MTRIAENSGLATFVNMFTVEPSHQQEVLDLLAEATETTVRHAPGFVSAALHRGVDGTKIAMYSQWESAAHYRQYQATLAEPNAAPYVQRVLAIAKFEPTMVDVVKVFTGSAGPAGG